MGEIVNIYMDKITFNIPAELKKEFQLAVIKSDEKDMTTVLLDFIKKFVCSSVNN